MPEMSYVPSDQPVTKVINKAEVTSIQIDRHDSQSTASAAAPDLKTRSWKTTFLRLGPLTGVACMMTAAASIVAALGILIGSRGAAVTTWTIPPSTYLAICTAIANQALRFAAFQGLAIGWWFRATRGDTLAQLHRSWRAGMTAGGAIISGRNMGLIGLACLCSTLVAIDGPLLQKATTIELAPFDAPPVSLDVSIVPEPNAPPTWIASIACSPVPRDYSGGWYKTSRAFKLSPSFNKTIPTVNGNTSNLVQILDVAHGFSGTAWFEDVAIPGAVRGCPPESVCRSSVRAPALAVTSCISKKLPVDYWIRVKNKKNLLQLTRVAPPLDTLNFLIDISLMLAEKEKINLITGYGRSDNCTGHFYYDICTLESAIGEYNITITKGDKVTLAPSPPRIIALANNTQVNHNWNAYYKWYPSTLAGIATLAFQKYESAASEFVDDGVMTSIGFNPNTYRQYADISAEALQQSCWLYRSPQADILYNMNRLMFLVGTEAANLHRITKDSSLDPGIQTHTTVQGYLEGKHNVFATNLHWFGGAVVVELLCIALILPTYFGFWKLGRSVSFSPLEVAKAFEAPLLSDCNSNSSGSEIAKNVGHIRIQYGQVNPTMKDSNEAFDQSKLAFAVPSIVNRPQKNATFGT